jgi:anthranilate synthase/aminodeoxychorismate synthase-like glutamine amidotransferase
VKVLLVDHEDSFVFNISQALESAGADVVCLRASRPLREAVRVDPDALVLSPGPGRPDDPRTSGMARALLDRWADERPFLGVCLGHQIIAEHFGARVGLAPEPVHGATSRVRHDGRGLFRGVRSPTPVARYHSLLVEREGLPACLEVAARGEHGVVMALRHRTRPIESVQFHPESYLTPSGPRMFRNFLAGARR